MRLRYQNSTQFLFTFLYVTSLLIKLHVLLNPISRVDGRKALFENQTIQIIFPNTQILTDDVDMNKLIIHAWEYCSGLVFLDKSVVSFYTAGGGQHYSPNHMIINSAIPCPPTINHLLRRHMNLAIPWLTSADVKLIQELYMKEEGVHEENVSGPWRRHGGEVRSQDSGRIYGTLSKNNEQIKIKSRKVLFQK